MIRITSDMSVWIRLLMTEGQIGALIGQGKHSEAEAAKEQTARYKEQSKLLGDKLNEYEKTLRDKLLQVPNLPHESVPEGCKIGRAHV